LPGVYIPHFGQILVKISVFGVLPLVVAPIGVKFGVEQGTDFASVRSSTPNLTPIGATYRPCGAKNLKIGL